MAHRMADVYPDVEWDEPTVHETVTTPTVTVDADKSFQNRFKVLVKVRNAGPLTRRLRTLKLFMCVVAFLLRLKIEVEVCEQ